MDTMVPYGTPAEVSTLRITLVVVQGTLALLLRRRPFGRMTRVADVNLRAQSPQTPGMKSFSFCLKLLTQAYRLDFHHFQRACGVILR